MTILRLFRILVLFVFLIQSTGCAVIFSSSKQNITVTSQTPGATIRFEGDSIGNGSTTVKLNKYRVYNMFVAEKEGFKSRGYCVTFDQYAPTIALAVVDAAAFILPVGLISRAIQKDGSVTFSKDMALIPGAFLFSLLLTDLKHAKTHLYESDPQIPELKPYEVRNSNEKYLLVNKTNIDVPARQMKFVSYNRLKKYYGAGIGNEKSGISYTRNNIKVENTSFSGPLNYTLHKMKFIDTSDGVFPNISNCLYLDATVKKITFHEVTSPYLNTAKYTSNVEKVMPNHLFSVELAIDWDILDYYRQKIATIRTVERSDLTTLHYQPSESELESALTRVMKDNLEFSIMSLRSQLADKGLLKTAANVTEEKTIEIARPQVISDKKEDFKKYCVAINVADSLGSGTVISEDGYIVTNFHYMVGREIADVIFSDGSTALARIVRSNPEYDLALLKVEKTGLPCVTLSEEDDPEIGIDIWAVGITHRSDKTIRLSHGIISGVRKVGEKTLLQTDASLTVANGGGPLINEKGTANGIISYKISGKGVEGIGFAMSARQVLLKLNLKYK